MCWLAFRVYNFPPSAVDFVWQICWNFIFRWDLLVPEVNFLISFRLCVSRFVSQINSILNHFSHSANFRFAFELFSFFFFSICRNWFEYAVYMRLLCPERCVPGDTRIRFLVLLRMDHTNSVLCHTDFNWNWLIFLYRLHDNRELFNRIYWSWSTRSTVSISLCLYKTYQCLVS